MAKEKTGLARGGLQKVPTGIEGLDEITNGGLPKARLPWCAVLWATLSFLLNYVPNIGSIIAALPVALLALVQLGWGLPF